MGGIAYLDGTWFKADPPFYNTSSEQPPVVSFSGTPCRDGFARGASLSDIGALLRSMGLFFLAIGPVYSQ